VILVSRDRRERRFRKHESLEIVAAVLLIGVVAVLGRQIHDVEPGLVSVHRIQNYLRKNQVTSPPGAILALLT
jgi:hypothetical protein